MPLTHDDVRQIVSQQLAPFSDRITALELARARAEAEQSLIAQSIATSNTTMTELGAKMDAWRETFERQLADQRHTTNILGSMTSTNNAEIKHLKRLLYGDPNAPDAPASLFALVRDIRAEQAATREALTARLAQVEAPVTRWRAAESSIIQSATSFITGNWRAIGATVITIITTILYLLSN